MRKNRLQKPKVPFFQMFMFAIGVAVLAMVNSCGYSNLRVANALPIAGKKAQPLVSGSLDTAVLTSQLREKHEIKLVLSSKVFSGSVDVKIRTPKLNKVDTKIDFGKKKELISRQRRWAQLPRLDLDYFAW